MKYDDSNYYKREPSERAQQLVSEMRTNRTLQKSGSDIALSHSSFDLNSRGNISIPSSTMSVAKSFRSKSYKMLPPPSEYYYQSSFKNANRLKALEEDRESDSSDEDHQPTIYPERRFLMQTTKI